MKRRSMMLDPVFDRQHYRSLSPSDLDTLPYGVIVLDRTGTIVDFNRAESRFTGIARERVLGKNFFKDVAPCANVREFCGRFEAFVAGDRTSVEAFEFFFPFVAGTQRVTIFFIRDPDAMERISIIVVRFASNLAGFTP